LSPERRREITEWTEDALVAALDGVSSVVHAAAVVHRPGAPLSEYRLFNVEGTRALLNASSTAGVRHIVFLSSIKVYGEEPEGTIDETTPIDLSPGYSGTKVEAERLLRDADEQGGPKATILRLCPVFGPGDKGNVRHMALAIARRRFLLPGDGSTRKSVVHISTVCRAVLAALADPKSGLFVVADRVAPSMRDLADALASILGKTRVRSMPVPLVLAAAGAIESVSRLRGRTPSVSRELIRKSLRSTVCSPRALEDAFGIDCHVDLRAALEEEVAWLKSERLL
jgi:UDP-glucose 4-epimerase